MGTRTKVGHHGGVSRWLARRTVWEYALLLCCSCVLTGLLVTGALTWTSGQGINVLNFVVETLVVLVVFLPGSVWAHKQRLDRHRVQLPPSR